MKVSLGEKVLPGTNEYKLCWPWKKFCCLKDSKYIGLDDGLIGGKTKQNKATNQNKQTNNNNKKQLHSLKCYFYNFRNMKVHFSKAISF